MALKMLLVKPDVEPVDPTAEGVGRLDGAD